MHASLQAALHPTNHPHTLYLQVYTSCRSTLHKRSDFLVTHKFTPPDRTRSAQRMKTLRLGYPSLHCCLGPLCATRCPARGDPELQRADLLAVLLRHERHEAAQACDHQAHHRVQPGLRQHPRSRPCSAGVIDRLGNGTSATTTQLSDYGVRNFSPTGVYPADNYHTGAHLSQVLARSRPLPWYAWVKRDSDTGHKALVPGVKVGLTVPCCRARVPRKKGTGATNSHKQCMSNRTNA